MEDEIIERTKYQQSRQINDTVGDTEFTRRRYLDAEMLLSDGYLGNRRLRKGGGEEKASVIFLTNLD